MAITSALPVVYDAPAVPSQGYGLYAAATLLNSDVPRELMSGVDLLPFNCDTGFGTYSTELCSADEPAEKAPGERGDPQHFDPMIVWAAAECAPDQTEDEEMARARQILALQEPLLVESAFAARLLADAGTADTAASLLEAIGLAEAWMGERGYPGVIHASRRYAAEAGSLNALNGSGAVYRTHLGNIWAFGGGYDSALENTIVITGPVTVWRTAPFEQVVTTGSHAENRFNNTVYALTERVITAGYECAAHAITISTP